MKLFQRYMLQAFIRYVIVVELVIVVVTFLFDAIDEYGSLAKYHATIQQILVLETITIPNKVITTLPMSIMLATMLTIVTLMHKKELLAYVSIGGRIRNILYPFIITSFAGCILMICYDYQIYPELKTIYYRYTAEKIMRTKYFGTNKLTDLWIFDNNSVIYVRMIDPLNKTISGITEYTIDNNFHVNNIKNTDTAMYDNAKWLMKNIENIDMNTIPPITKKIDQEVITSQLFTDLTFISDKRPKELTQLELYRMIKVMQNHGLNSVNYQMILYEKYAKALSAIVLVLIVAPIGIDFSRRYSIIRNVLLSFSCVISFWAVWITFRSLGSLSIVPPLVANFSPHVLFTCISYMIVIFREKAQ